MSHSYASAYPTAATVSEGIKAFFENFYRISDTPTAHSEYVRQFAQDATFKLASKTAKGHDGISPSFIPKPNALVFCCSHMIIWVTFEAEILATREGMWAAVESRLHSPLKIFPFGGDDEFMLYGTVAYTLKDGRKAEVEWAGRAELVSVGGDWRFKYYQVYLVSLC